MSEESYKMEQELKQAFAKLFPLAREQNLPWAPSHIEAFLKDRLAKELDQNVQGFTSEVVKVLCEVTPLKTNVADMACMVVNKAKWGTESVAKIQVRLKVLKERQEKANTKPTPESILSELQELLKLISNDDPSN